MEKQLPQQQLSKRQFAFACGVMIASSRIFGKIREFLSLLTVTVLPATFLRFSSFCTGKKLFTWYIYLYPYRIYKQDSQPRDSITERSFLVDS